jgi:sortase (surface protein transpeptidase)
VRIPAIGVDSRIVNIGVDATGALIPPATTEVTGWFRAGPVPGAIGPALLAGHVDSRAGPGVFFRLTELRPGDVVTVDRADHTSVSFVVDSSTRVSKTAFPTDLVYSPKPVAMLRLITCGGSFDSSVRSYRDNIIVNATIR